MDMVLHGSLTLSVIRNATNSGSATGQFVNTMFNVIEGSLLDYSSAGQNSSFSLLLNNKPQGPIDVGSFPVNVLGKDVNFDVTIGLAAQTKMNVIVNWPTMTANASFNPPILLGVGKWGIPLPAAGTIKSASFSPSGGLRVNYNSSLIGAGSITVGR